MGGAEICQIFCCFFGKFKISKRHSEINWPLEEQGIGTKTRCPSLKITLKQNLCYINSTFRVKSKRLVSISGRQIFLWKSIVFNFVRFTKQSQLKESYKIKERGHSHKDLPQKMNSKNHFVPITCYSNVLYVLHMV